MLLISDVDNGEDLFADGSYAGDLGLGTLVLTEDGAWTYTLVNADLGVQGLDDGDIVIDDVAIQSVDGTVQTVSITINGTDEPSGNKNGQTIVGQSGDIVITTGKGSDVVSAGADDNVISTGQGDDVVQGGDGEDTVNGGSGSDIIFGDAGNDTLFGENSDDTIHGGPGDDEIHGGNSSDTIFGDAGNDTLFGENGNDVIDPGEGEDIMAGGNGNDVFVFDLDGQLDTVTDFKDGSDQIRIDGITFDELTIQDSADGAIISFDGNEEMVLEGINAAQITADDFFVGS